MMGDLRVPFTETSSTYELRYVKISNGKFPSGRSDLLIAFLGLEFAKLMPRYSPMAFHGVFFVDAIFSSLWAAFANVSR